jgi:hypothetical protein
MKPMRCVANDSRFDSAPRYDRNRRAARTLRANFVRALFRQRIVKSYPWPPFGEGSATGGTIGTAPIRKHQDDVD